MDGSSFGRLFEAVALHICVVVFDDYLKHAFCKLMRWAQEILLVWTCFNSVSSQMCVNKMFKTQEVNSAAHAEQCSGRIQSLFSIASFRQSHDLLWHVRLKLFLQHRTWAFQLVHGAQIDVICDALTEYEGQILKICRDTEQTLYDLHGKAGSCH